MVSVIFTDTLRPAPDRAPEMGDPIMIESDYSRVAPQEVSRLFDELVASSSRLFGELVGNGLALYVIVGEGHFIGDAELIQQVRVDLESHGAVRW